MANTFNLDPFIQEIKQAGEKGKQAAALAINEVSEWARSDTTAYINARYSLQGSYAQQNITVARYARSDNLEAVMASRRRATQITRFQTRQVFIKGKTVAKKRGGVSAKILRQKAPTHLKSAFYIKLKNGATGVAVRKSNRRDDLKILYGPSVASAFKWVRDKNNLPKRMLDQAIPAFFKYLDK